MPTELSFRNARGSRIAADHYASSGDAVVVMANDLLTHKRWRERYAKIATALNIAGIGALAFDYCGTGESDDDLTCVATIIADLRAALSEARRLGARRIALWGHGLLSGFCLDAFESDVATVVLSAASIGAFDFAQVGGFETHELEELNRTGEIVTCSMDPSVRSRQVLTSRLFKDFAAVDQSARLSRVACPVLLINGNSPTDPEELHRLTTNRAAMPDLPAGSQLAVIEGASHSFAGHIDELVAVGVNWLIVKLADNPAHLQLGESRG